MIRRLFVFLCQSVAACTIGLMACSVVVRGVSDADWRLYVVALTVTMGALWMVVVFKD